MFVMCSALSVRSQDLMVNATPIHRHIKKLDSLKLVNFFDLKMHEEVKDFSHIYKTWENTRIHADGVIPDTFNVYVGNFTMPSKSTLVTSQYGVRWGKMHNGTDIKVFLGDTIYAAFEGKVRIVGYDKNGYGKYIVIRHNNGLETLYAHMSAHIVKANQHVKSGQPIGLGGNTGRSTGSHLHFETRLCGNIINPEDIFDFKMGDVRYDKYYVFVKKKNESQNRSYANATIRKNINKVRRIKR